MTAKVVPLISRSVPTTPGSPPTRLRHSSCPITTKRSRSGTESSSAVKNRPNAGLRPSVGKKFAETTAPLTCDESSSVCQIERCGGVGGDEALKRLRVVAKMEVLTPGCATYPRPLVACDLDLDDLLRSLHRPPLQIEGVHQRHHRRAGDDILDECRIMLYDSFMDSKRPSFPVTCERSSTTRSTSFMIRFPNRRSIMLWSVSSGRGRRFRTFLGV